MMTRTKVVAERLEYPEGLDSFGARVRWARTTYGERTGRSGRLSQEALARLADPYLPADIEPRIHRDRIMSIERGDVTSPRGEVALALAKALEVSPEWLLAGRTGLELTNEAIDIAREWLSIQDESEREAIRLLIRRSARPHKR